MAKENNTVMQRRVFKIKSSRLRKNKWNLKLSIKEAKKNEELISLADSTTLRFIRDITGENPSEEEYLQLRKRINKIKVMPTSIENKKQIKALYEQLDSLMFVKDYVCVVMMNNKDYDRANKGFFINGIKYKRLLATTGGVKNNVIIYVSDYVYDELNRRLNNGRNPNVKLIPAKLEAYKALACSASIPVTNTDKIIVVPDCVTKFKTDVIKLDDAIANPPKVHYEKDCPIELEDSDGFGLITPKLSKKWTEELDNKDYISSGFCIRNSFCKGMLFTFDFHDFADKIAKDDWVTDIWGDKRNIKDAEIILTGSMLKLHSSYNNLEDYLRCCKENGYGFSVTKVIPKELENERNLNYQFIQSLKLNDDDIDELLQPTIDEITDILGGDYRKAILFLKGCYLTEDLAKLQSPDFAKAIMVDKRMIEDPFVRYRIHNMIEKRINDAKVGVLKINGNFSIISGDPYSLCQSMFGLEVTGLLKAGEFYSRYWNERDVQKVAAFRAPMTCHNNIRILRFKNTNEMQYWYKYMNRCTILNSWDTTTHAMNGADKDSDTILTTNNPVILRGIEEREAILCVQKQAEKTIPTEEDLIQSNKNGFGDAIGTITNKITSMFAVKAQFEEGSKEYETLESRIMWGQHFQQLAIDKIKGVVGEPMPSEWYSYHANMIDKNDTEEIKEKKRFNIRILADKKPYFMAYIYPHEMKKYKTYVNKAKRNCMMRFGITLDELIDKDNKTEDEEIFLKYYYLKMPLNTYPCLMNKICYKIEEEFDDVFKSFDRNSNFDYSILKCDNIEYSKSTYDKIKIIYKKYKKEAQRYIVKIQKERIEDFTKRDMRNIFIEKFKHEAYQECNNEEELCNIVLDLCYTNNDSKQFAWDVCGDVIINNLLKKNNYIIKYPELDKDGDIEFGGYNFSMKETKITEEEF